jgi:signal transduction histidine kinase
VGRLSYASVQRELRVHDLELADAVRAERLRLARELHDIVAHSVTLMILQAAGARAVAGAGDERVCRSLSVIEEAGGQAMAELHRLLGLLRSADPDSDSTAVDSHLRVGDVAQLVELAHAAGQQVQLSVDGAGGQLDPSVDLAAFRVVQEGLTNAAKHGAGAATTVRLTWRKDSLHIEICNSVSDTSRDRAAMARLSSGLGVQGLRGPVPGGYQLVAELPRSGSYLGQHRAPAGAVR